MAAEEAVRALLDHTVLLVDSAMVLRAIARSRRYRLSPWDALIVQAAVETRCERLRTEDLQDGQEMDGVRIENPFA